MSYATARSAVLALVLATVPSQALAQARVQVRPHNVTAPAGGAAGGDCTGGEDISQTWTNNATALNTADNPAIGQSITAPCTGSWEVVSFSVATVVTPGSLLLEIHQGAGDAGAVLSTTTVEVQAPGVHTVDLPQPVAVTDGAVYTFKLSIPAGQGTSATIADWWGGGTGERYPGGVEYNVAFGGGGTVFGPDPDYDLTFGADFEPAGTPGCDVVQLLSDGAIDLNTAFNAAVGQSFVAPCDGLLRSVSFWVWTVDEPGPLSLAVHEGLGDAGSVVAAAAVQVDTVGLHTVAFATPVPVNGSGAYTFKLTVPVGQITAVNLEEHAGNPYAGGMEFNVAYAGGGGTFAGDPEYDLAFSVDIDLVSPVEGDPGARRGTVRLVGVTPNPVEGGAVVALELAEAAVVRVDVYDAVGRRVGTVQDGPLSAGSHALRWASTGLRPGVYVLRVSAGSETLSRSIVVR